MNYLKITIYSSLVFTCKQKWGNNGPSPSLYLIRVLRSLVFSLYVISWVMPKLVVWSIACWRGYFKRHQYHIVWSEREREREKLQAFGMAYYYYHYTWCVLSGVRGMLGTLWNWILIDWLKSLFLNTFHLDASLKFLIWLIFVDLNLSFPSLLISCILLKYWGYTFLVIFI